VQQQIAVAVAAANMTTANLHAAYSAAIIGLYCKLIVLSCTLKIAKVKFK
jgi:hypothetical protein